MPMKSFNTKADFDDAYSYNGEPEGHPNTRPGIEVHYVKEKIYPTCQKIAAKLQRSFNFNPQKTMLFVGAGFGWTAECLEKDHGLTKILCVDTSAWVQAKKDTTEEEDFREAVIKVGLDPEAGEGYEKYQRLCGSKEIRSQVTRGIINRDVTNLSDRTLLLSTFGGSKFETAITENVLSCLYDSEAINLSSALNQLAKNVYHMDYMKSDNQDVGYNWKFQNEWETLLPNDTILDLLQLMSENW
jgi:hypothetical protein